MMRRVKVDVSMVFDEERSSGCREQDTFDLRVEEKAVTKVYMKSHQ